MVNKPQRIQLSRQKGFRLQEFSKQLNGREAVKVDRSTRYGNPFVVGKHGTVDDCLRMYEKMFLPYTHENGSLDQLFISEINLLDFQDKLRGKNLACWCKKDAKCHADILLRIANE